MRLKDIKKRTEDADYREMYRSLEPYEPKEEENSKQAYDWLFKGNAECVRLCIWAGVHPELVKDAVQASIDSVMRDLGIKKRRKPKPPQAWQQRIDDEGEKCHLR